MDYVCELKLDARPTALRFDSVRWRWALPAATELPGEDVTANVLNDPQHSPQHRGAATAAGAARFSEARARICSYRSLRHRTHDEEQGRRTAKFADPRNATAARGDNWIRGLRRDAVWNSPPTGCWSMAEPFSSDIPRLGRPPDRGASR